MFFEIAIGHNIAFAIGEEPN